MLTNFYTDLKYLLTEKIFFWTEMVKIKTMMKQGIMSNRD